MKPKQILKIAVDIAMTVLFIVLMAYHVTGNKLHEWLGAALFLLFILHHILNLKWYGGIFKGKYTASRVLMTTINSLLFASMVGMMISGVLLSREVFGFLNLRAGMFGRRLHMVSTAWGFCFMAAHLGLHWGMAIRAAKKIPTHGRKAFHGKWTVILARGIAVILSCYGVYAFCSRQIMERMFLLMEYAFFDYEEPAVLFFADYMSILIFFAALSYYLAKLLRKKRGE